MTVSSTLNVLTDFTGDRGKVAKALTALGYAEGTATPPPDAATAATDEAAAAATDDAAAETSDLDMFNNDIRLRALKTLADTLAPIEQKKAIIYFSAGMQRSGQDNQVELRAAINAAVRGQRRVLHRSTRAGCRRSCRAATRVRRAAAATRCSPAAASRSSTTRWPPRRTR